MDVAGHAARCSVHVMCLHQQAVHPGCPACWLPLLAWSSSGVTSRMHAAHAGTRQREQHSTPVTGRHVPRPAKWPLPGLQAMLCAASNAPQPQRLAHTNTVLTAYSTCRSPVSLGNSPTPQMLAIHRAAGDQGRGPPRLDSHVEEALLEGSSEDGDYPHTPAAEPHGYGPEPVSLQHAGMACAPTQSAGLGQADLQSQNWCSEGCDSQDHQRTR